MTGLQRRVARLTVLFPPTVEPDPTKAWLQVPEFQSAYREARRAAFQQATARFQQASSAAVSALLKVIVDAASPASSRVRAADCILGHAKQAIELEDVEARVTELEAAAKRDAPQKR